MRRLTRHFGRDGGKAVREHERKKRSFEKQRQDKNRREREADLAEEQLESFAIGMVAATLDEIEAFEARLDTYDEATVRALMINQERLDAVNDEIMELLARAHMLDDGRRVFLTEDRTKAFDEFGTEVTSEELDFDTAPPGVPTWETYSAKLDRQRELIEEREQIIEYQTKLDHAREEIGDGEISKDDLEALDAELLDAMPLTVRREISEAAPAADRPAIRAHFAGASSPGRGVGPTDLPELTPEP